MISRACLDETVRLVKTIDAIRDTIGYCQVDTRNMEGRIDSPWELFSNVNESSLDIAADYYKSPIHGVMLLPPSAQRIKSLELKSASSDEV